MNRYSHRLFFETLEDRRLLAASPTITEFMASNRGFLDDGDGQSSDWIEIHNGGDESVDLAGYRMTDKPDNLSRWTFPRVTLDAGQYLLVFASDQDVDNYVDAEGQLHTNFALKADGEYLALISPNGMILSEFGTSRAEYPEQRPNISYGVAQQGAGLDAEIGYMTTPTPGASNVGPEQVFSGYVSATQVDVNAGFFDQSFEITIQTATPEALIRFTTDGSAPTSTTGEIYTGPIRVDTTTVLRSAAFKDDYVPSAVQTATYLFLQDVIRQPAQPPGFPAQWGRTTADYEMDPEAVDDPAYSQEIIDGLTSIASMSIVMDPEELFGAAGIYINPNDRGKQWERAASVEIIHPSGTTLFQANGGIRIHGESTRGFAKRSFRLLFRDEYGPKKLNYPLFPDAPVNRFDNIVLRAGAASRDPTFIRDAFVRDTARDMGKIDGHATFVHLYLNGLYWGLYNPIERPDAQFAEEYFGGSDDNFDSLQWAPGLAITDGDAARFRDFLEKASSRLFLDESIEDIERTVDLDNVFDLLLIWLYLGRGEREFRAINHREGDPRIRFFVWDADLNLNGVGAFFDFLPFPFRTSLATALRSREDFRVRFAKRVHMHLFNDGAMTPQAMTQRWETRTTEIKKAIFAEEARWGDVTHDRWDQEVSRVAERIFPEQTDVVIDLLVCRGLFYPKVDAGFDQRPCRAPFEAGDGNRDKQFDQLDIVQVLQVGRYLTGESASWEDGDWNDDGLFDQLDLVAALVTGNYLAGPYAANSSREFILAEYGSEGSNDSSLGSSLLAVESTDSLLDKDPFDGQHSERL